MSAKLRLIKILKEKLSYFTEAGRINDLYRRLFLVSEEGKVVFADLLHKSGLYDAPGPNCSSEELWRIQGRRDLMTYIVDKCNLPNEILYDLNNIEYNYVDPNRDQ